MSEFLTAKEKADELGISTNGLAKTRHLYKHIKKSPRKYLYFKEEESEAIRPNKVNAPGLPVNSRHRRRDVPFGDTQYSKVKGRGGEHFKILNQMRSKLALEGKIPKKKLNDFTEALASKVNENYEEINGQRRHKLQMELMANDERTKKQMIRRQNPIQAEPVRRYPYTNISGYYPGPPSTRWVEDETKEPKKVYKYY